MPLRSDFLHRHNPRRVSSTEEITHGNGQKEMSKLLYKFPPSCAAARLRIHTVFNGMTIVPTSELLSNPQPEPDAIGSRRKSCDSLQGPVP